MHCINALLYLILSLLQWSSHSFVPFPRIQNTFKTSNQGLNSQDDSTNNSDDIMKEDELSDWREFRSKLMATTSGESRPKSVSKKNEALLKEQNDVLAKEYASGVWAHTTPEAEVGGLICRMPLESELYRSGILSRKRNMDNESIESWYSTAQDFIQETLDSLPKPPFDPSILPKEIREIFSLYLSSMQTWQEVALVHSKTSQQTNIMVINRPMALKVSEDLASLILFGSDMKRNVGQTGDLVRFLVAFENECYVYVGGPDNHIEPATLLHGIPTLPNSKEISPGSGIFTAPVKSAVDAVMSGQHKPIDFRFVFGMYEKSNSQLEYEIELGKYLSVACSRSIVLKQCVGLPKPLWHEIMELCGGEHSEISGMEMKKRSDLQPDE